MTPPPLPPTPPANKPSGPVWFPGRIAVMENKRLLRLKGALTRHSSLRAVNCLLILVIMVWAARLFVSRFSFCANSVSLSLSALMAAGSVWLRSDSRGHVCWLEYFLFNVNQNLFFLNVVNWDQQNVEILWETVLCHKKLIFPQENVCGFQHFTLVFAVLLDNFELLVVS